MNRRAQGADQATQALPREIAQRIHPEWRKNEADYWATRDKLLPQYRLLGVGAAFLAIGVVFLVRQRRADRSK